jgi:hypothetical protein
MLENLSNNVEYKRMLVTLLSTEVNSSVKWPHIT